MSLLEIKNLHISLHGTEIIDGINMSIRAGEIVALVGESGSGKSISMQAPLGLIPANLSGSFTYQGVELLGKSRKELSSILGCEISFIFQDPLTSLNPTMRIGKQIIEGGGITKEEACALLEKVGIDKPVERYEQYPFELSGGMRQRVMIAIALARKPNLLIADEPTTALDVCVQAQILTLLRNLQEEKKMALLLITHDFGIVSEFCERVYVMYAGKIVESGTKSAILQGPKHPYTKALLQAVPRLHQKKGERLYTIPGRPPEPELRASGCPFWPRCPYAMQICTQSPPEINLGSSQKAACWLHDESYLRIRPCPF